MKKTLAKRLIAVAMTVTMVLAMALPASAVTKYNLTLTITDKNDIMVSNTSGYVSLTSDGLADVLVQLISAGIEVKDHKTGLFIFGIVCAVLALVGILEVTGLVSGIPILALGIPAVLSLYFDLFSGFVQALVFSLLSMVYISSSLPEEPETAAVEA